MYQSGDAAEQVVRIGLEGAEFALKVTGSAAKNVAAALYVVLKDQKKTKGRARIASMLREKRPLKVYTIKKTDCPEFARQARGYGILYAPIPVRKKDDTVDILVFEDDAARANRIVERFNLTVVDTSAIQESIERSRGEQGSGPAVPGQGQAARENPGQGDSKKSGDSRQEDFQKSGDDSLLEELLGAPAQKEKNLRESPGLELPEPLGKGLPKSPGPELSDPPGPELPGPFGKAAEKSPPSAITFGNSSRSARGTSDGAGKPSVRKELWDIQVRQKKEKAAGTARGVEPPVAGKNAGQKTTRHRQPGNRKRAKRKRGRSR